MFERLIFEVILMATVTTSYSGNGPPPGVLHGEFTLLDVGSAVSRQLGLMPDSSAVAGLAGKLHSFVNTDQAFRTSGLDGSNFRTLVISNLTPEIARELNRDQANQIRKDQQASGVGTPGNNFALGQGHRFMVNGVLVSEGGKAEAGYGSLPGTLTSTQKAALDIVGKYPELGWVKGNTELLSLGPSAIQALADVHFKAESFNKLKGVEFAASDVVTLARFAKKTNRDANDLADRVAHGNKALATDETGKVNTQVLKDLRDAEMTYMANPESLAAKEGMTAAVAKAAGNDPKKQEEGRKLEEAMGTQKKLENKSDAKVKATDAEADAMLAALNGGSKPSGSNSQKPESSSSSQAKPETPASTAAGQAKPDKAKPPKAAPPGGPK
ncbi:hypothetical protein QWJ07_24430 [Frankia sp. RB7]|nr:hypothetical protein [Frankia sp. RB7]